MQALAQAQGAGSNHQPFARFDEIRDRFTGAAVRRGRGTIIHQDIEAGQCWGGQAVGSFADPHIESARIIEYATQERDRGAPIVIALAGDDQEVQSVARGPSANVVCIRAPG